ncbi:MAG: branched-chain amino acid ABC transporter permease [Rhodospirillaceae bacterium]|nr:branched-chain amino acid ABC transporter permease [Rhodospirillaceae bacterium]
MAEAVAVKAGVSRFDLPQVLKEAALAAFVAFLLALPLAGLHLTAGDQGAMVVETRWSWVAIGVVAVFVGRLLLAVLRAVRPATRLSSGVAERGRQRFAAYLPYAAVAALIAAVALPFLPFSDRYIVDLGTTVLIYIMLAWGLNIVVGLAGLLDLGYVAFYAVGAYTYALLGTTYGWSFWVCLPVAGTMAAFFGILLGYPVLRLRGDYLAIVTLGFGEIIRIILLNWVAFTGGPNGISSIPRPSFFGLPFTRRPDEGEVPFHEFFGIDYSGEHRVIFLYYLILILALITNLFVLRIRKLPIGRAWEALREDEIACRALGLNPTNIKLSAFALGAMFGGFAGSFFATRQGFISPESFVFIESAIILAIVVLGGMGSQTGVVLAGIALIVLPEIAREFAEFRMLVFGGAMVLIMTWRPRGLLSHREPTVRLAPRGKGAG